MNRRLAVIDAGVVDARKWPDACRALVERATPQLLVARLSGAVASLGRWQRGASVLRAELLEEPPVRRPTGGRAAALGEGMLAVAICLPHRSWLVSDEVDALDASRLLNRAIRGVLAGLGTMGVSAKYFGRDYVSVDSTQAGLTGFEIAPGGVALVDCVWAAEAHWWLPSHLNALPDIPPVRGVPGPGQVGTLAGCSSSRLLEHVSEGYRSTFGVETFEEAFDDRLVSFEELADLPLRSALHPVPAGFVEAQARVVDGRIVECRFHGDFNADSAGILALQQTLVGAAPLLDEIAPRMNDVYRNAGRFILGVADLEVFASALLEACAR